MATARWQAITAQRIEETIRKDDKANSRTVFDRELRLIDIPSVPHENVSDCQFKGLTALENHIKIIRER